MYTALLHTHKAVVILFLIIYLAKTVLLFVNKETLAKFTKIAKIPEMIISFLFLGTGVGMWFMMAEPAKMLFLIKVGAVLISIPLAVIGFKKDKENKALAVLAMVLIIAAYGLAEMSRRSVAKQDLAGITDPTAQGYEAVEHGKEVYSKYCVSCHGADGALGVSGAKNLQLTQLSTAESIDIITNGKNAMAPYKKVLSEADIKAVAAYTATLKK